MTPKQAKQISREISKTLDGLRLNEAMDVLTYAMLVVLRQADEDKRKLLFLEVMADIVIEMEKMDAAEAIEGKPGTKRANSPWGYS